MPTAVAPRFALLRVAAATILVTGLLLAARPLDDGRTPPTMTAGPETVLVPAPIDEDSVPSLAVSYAPRRAGATMPVVARAATSGPAPVLAPSVAPAAPPGEVVVVVLDTPPPIPPIATVEAARGSAVGEVLFAAVPHAGLTPQTP